MHQLKCKRPFFRLVARCLLSAAAWQGPIPWCHCHRTLANTAQSASTWLAEHFNSYHSAALAYLNVDLGWHFHVAFPSDHGGNKSSKPSPHRELLPQSKDPTLTDCARQLAEISPVNAVVMPSTASTRLEATAPTLSAHFFDGFAPSLPLPLRFCIARP
jgi:hypothetical protein